MKWKSSKADHGKHILKRRENASKQIGTFIVTSEAIKVNKFADAFI